MPQMTPNAPNFATDVLGILRCARAGRELRLGRCDSGETSGHHAIRVFAAYRSEPGVEEHGGVGRPKPICA